ncbi:hypothetical protein [Andreesenia angusta]|uniref:hypothetical protein n=1 Tax=Andreesenia angusta TaxID=39480 RepID=UPI0008DA68C7|nr:hypothetical protein [Andreesenia angusta]
MSFSILRHVVYDILYSRRGEYIFYKLIYDQGFYILLAYRLHIAALSTLSSRALIRLIESLVSSGFLSIACHSTAALATE